MHGHAGRRLLSGGPDGGAAVVEFVLVATLLVGLLLGVLQLALVLHMRNVVVASLAEGARSAANADRDCADGAATARELVVRALSERIADRLAFDVPEGGCEEPVGGVVLVRLRVRGTVPVLLLPLAAVPVQATARAVKEGR